jgi:hypothetical protein
MQQFCDKHLDKIKNYILNVKKKLQIPSEDSILKHFDSENICPKLNGIYSFVYVFNLVSF